MHGPKRARYRVREADSLQDVRAAQALRGLAFHGDAAHRDEDAFDAACTHILIEERATGRLVGCFRRTDLSSGAEIARSYSAQFYDLSRLTTFPARMIEMGRFCVHPASRDPDVVRAAWGAMTAYVDRHDVQMLFGCSSFPGTDAERFRDAFAVLRDHHIAPDRWRPERGQWPVFEYAARLDTAPDPRRARATLPPLLRTYLAMGGWVSDHAVIDKALGTLHVFTAVEIAAVPPARARLLRALAGQARVEMSDMAGTTPG